VKIAPDKEELEGVWTEMWGKKFNVMERRAG
jgi:hypothetical protein